MSLHRASVVAVSVIVLLAMAPRSVRAFAPRPPTPKGHLTYTSPQSNPIVTSTDGTRVFVANTTSNSVSLLNAATLQRQGDVAVGLEPVSLAVRPGGSELWVSNHVSDSVSVVDIQNGSSTFGQVIETVQLLDQNGVTLFDEPVGIAFAGPNKAYVALSSRNQIGIIDATTYSVTGFIDVRAQEPRAIAVRNGLLYVAAFESGNQSQLSACITASNTDPNCTLGVTDLVAFASSPNLPTKVKNIVKEPNAPDRDLFVYDTTTDQEVGVVTHMGTLLYGLTVDSTGTAYVAQTDARNTVNGLDGDVLASLSNMMFDNEIASVHCSLSGCAGPPAVHDLEPPQTTPATALATPYGIAIDEANAHLLLTAAGSSRVASTTLTGTPISVLNVGAIPRGIAFRPRADGSGGTAWVLATLDNQVLRVDVAANGTLTAGTTQTVGNDPTPPEVRRGRIAMNNAFASNSGNFSCGSCHPDGNTDQLLWRIGGNCEAMGCAPGDEPRSTMPIRGLKNTLPLHWDGSLGDPFGGPNGSVGSGGNVPPRCNTNGASGDHSCFVDLSQAALTGVMCTQPCAGANLNAQEIDDMAFFLAGVDYPPARSRRMDDSISRNGDGVTIGSPPNALPVNALQGFSDFFMNQGGFGAPASCADINAGCHALPLGASTNSSTLQAFDAPTMRGMTDRFLQFSMGPTMPIQLLAAANFGGSLGFGFADPLETPIQWDANKGFEEITTFGVAFAIFQPVYNVRPLNLFQMFEEASTGTSGATGRQLTLNSTTALLPDTISIMSALEAADDRGVVALFARGLRNGSLIIMSYSNGTYSTPGVSLTSAQLRAEASTGTLLATLTAHLPDNAGGSPQPVISTLGGSIGGALGNPPLPRIATGGGSNPPPFNVDGVDVSASAVVLVDGQPQPGALISCTPSGGFCPNGSIGVDLDVKPAAGAHLLQVQNPKGLLSNELPICVGSNAACLSN